MGRPKTGPKMGGAVFTGRFQVVVEVETVVCFSIVRRGLAKKEGEKYSKMKEDLFYINPKQN